MSVGATAAKYKLDTKSPQDIAKLESWDGYQVERLSVDEVDETKLKEMFGEAEAKKILSSRGRGRIGALDSNEHEISNSSMVTARYTAFFSNPENDGWLARQAMNDLMTHPIIPEPEITKEVMHCCRRMNDYALAVRFLECVQFLMQNQKQTIWPWYHQEIGPTLKELGILTPEEMGYDKPELFLQDPDDIE